jgi:Zn-finger in ubiquitin-hydrolases and other protein
MRRAQNDSHSEAETRGKRKQGINLASVPTGTGCVECLAGGGWWLHLRRCAECGHIGCCDSSPDQHARKHAQSAGHPIVTSFEPLQNWFYDYEKDKIVKGMKLRPPRSHPESQPVPGPEGKVPPNWQELLHDS